MLISHVLLIELQGAGEDVAGLLVSGDGHAVQQVLGDVPRLFYSINHFSNQIVFPQTLRPASVQSLEKIRMLRATVKLWPA